MHDEQPGPLPAFETLFLHNDDDPVRPAEIEEVTDASQVPEGHAQPDNMSVEELVQISKSDSADTEPGQRNERGPFILPIPHPVRPKPVGEASAPTEEQESSSSVSRKHPVEPTNGGMPEHVTSDAPVEDGDDDEMAIRNQESPRAVSSEARCDSYDASASTIVSSLRVSSAVQHSDTCSDHGSAPVDDLESKESPQCDRVSDMISSFVWLREGGYG